MCETGRDCSPVAIWALVFNGLSSLLLIIIYIYLHVDYGVLSWYQHCGYLLVYFIGILDIVGSVLSILALKRGSHFSYTNYTPGMFILLLASCFNCFVFIAFSDTLHLVPMQEYLRYFTRTFGGIPGVLQDLQTTFGCCGIVNYTDYPKGLVPDSCCLEVDCAKDAMNYNKRFGCAIPPIPDESGVAKSFTMKITTKGSAIYHCPYMLLLTRTIVIIIYRCGMLDIIANGIPIGFGETFCSPPPERCSRTLSIIEKESRQSKISGTSGSGQTSRVDFVSSRLDFVSSRVDFVRPGDKLNIMSPSVTSVKEPRPHIVVKPPLQLMRVVDGGKGQPSYIITGPVEVSSQDQIHILHNTKSKSAKKHRKKTPADHNPGPEHKPLSVMHKAAPGIPKSSHDVPKGAPVVGNNLHEKPKASPVAPKTAVPVYDPQKPSSAPKASPNTRKPSSAPKASPDTGKPSSAPKASPDTRKASTAPKAAPDTRKASSAPKVSPNTRKASVATSKASPDTRKASVAPIPKAAPKKASPAVPNSSNIVNPPPQPVAPAPKSLHQAAMHSWGKPEAAKKDDKDQASVKPKDKGK